PSFLCHFVVAVLAFPSFPTRRSSDLSLVHGVGVPKALPGRWNPPGWRTAAGRPPRRLPPKRSRMRGSHDGALQPLLLDDDAETRSEEHTSELQSRVDLVCRLLLEKKK